MLRDDRLQLPPIVIRPSAGWIPLKLADLWEYRELLFCLVWKDFQIRYKQTIIGAAWVIIQPSFLTLAFTIFFGRLVGVPSDGVPYPVFAFCGLLPWQLFAQSVTNSANSLVINEKLITKVYFPRLIIPLAAVFSGCIDFVVPLVVLLALMAYYGSSLTSAVWLLPAFMLMAAATATGAGLWIAALNVEYRDIRYTVPFIIQFWFFISPVVYPSSLVPEEWRFIYSLNPMVGVVEGFRWSLLGAINTPALGLMISVFITLLLLLSGLYYFRRLENTLADVV